MKKRVIVYWKRSSLAEDPEPDQWFTEYTAEKLSTKDGFLTITESIGGLRAVHISLSEVHSWTEEPAK